MRRLVLPTLVTLSFIACGGVDDHPLGGPYGGTTDPTDPNGGQNGTDPNGDPNNTNDDAGTTQQEQQDSGTTQQQQKDSGTQQKDSGTTTPDSGTQTSVTWTTVFNSYLAGSTKGRCSSCHSQGSSKASLYTWLKGKGYISGSSSALVDSNQSCLSWYGGNMPTSGIL